LGMDALLHVMPPWGRKMARTLTLIFTGLVCAYVAHYGYQYVLLERDSPSDANSFIPGWIVALIFPFAFCGMAIRFLLHAVKAVKVNNAPLGSPAEEVK
jgi:TRAP-type C4-dicarboxylate transport system permease small subunit